MKDLLFIAPEAEFKQLIRMKVEGMSFNDFLAALISERGIEASVVLDPDNIAQLGDWWNKKNCVPDDVVELFNITESNPQIADVFRSINSKYLSKTIEPSLITECQLASFRHDPYLLSTKVGSTMNLNFAITGFPTSLNIAANTVLALFKDEYRPSPSTFSSQSDGDITPNSTYISVTAWVDGYNISTRTWSGKAIPLAINKAITYGKGIRIMTLPGITLPGGATDYHKISFNVSYGL